MIHKLKCWPEDFDAIVTGAKRFEIRREDDRHFEVGDTLVLQEFDPLLYTQNYSGREWVGLVRFLVRGPDWGLPLGMVVMSLAVIWDVKAQTGGSSHA